MRRTAAAGTVLALGLGLIGCGGGSGSSGANDSLTGSAGDPTVTASAPGTPTPIRSYRTPPVSLPVQPIHLSTDPPPWAPPAVIDGGAQSAAYVAAAGLPFAEEMLRVHYHAHLDVNVDGDKVTVPPYLGFVAQGSKVRGLAPLHTHDDKGIIHIENDVAADFLLGQVFVEWGVRFTADCLGPYCNDADHELAIFVNGERYGGDPTRLVLAKHQEIAIEYGKKGDLPKPPASYDFPSGL
jgi:hypothetical protein